jgi:hypothetical protein
MSRRRGKAHYPTSNILTEEFNVPPAIPPLIPPTILYPNQHHDDISAGDLSSFLNKNVSNPSGDATYFAGKMMLCLSIGDSIPCILEHENTGN